MNRWQIETIAHGSEAYGQAVQLRERILRAPLGLSFTEAELAAEKNHIHVVGRYAGAIHATAVLVPEGTSYKMQRVAVDSELQNQGLGSALMAFCEEHAKSNGVTGIYVHARETAVPFYLKHHYHPEGEMFDEDGIPHLKMLKRV